MEYLPGGDVSVYQGVIDWDKMAQKGLQYVAIRASVGDRKTDAMFLRNYSEAKLRNLLVTAYHVIDPVYTPESQLSRFLSSIQNSVLDFWPVLDVELHSGLPANAVSLNVRRCFSAWKNHFGCKPIIYTSAGFWNAYMGAFENLEESILWVANYTSAPQPTIPTAWKKLGWTFWQWSADRPPNRLGKEYGCQSTSIDLDRCILTRDQLAQMKIPPTHQELFQHMWNWAITQGMPPEL